MGKSTHKNNVATKISQITVVGAQCHTKTLYHIAGKFGKFGKSSVIHQTKTIQIFTYNYNLLAESIHLPNFFSSNARNK